MNVYYACIARNASKGGWVEDVDLIMAVLMLHGFIQMRGAEPCVSVPTPLALHVPHVPHAAHPCATPVRYLSHHVQAAREKAAQDKAAREKAAWEQALSLTCLPSPFP